MKRYEAPVVELTKFDVEDVITVSVQNLTTAEREAAILDIQNYADANGGAAEEYGNNIFAW